MPMGTAGDTSRMRMIPYVLLLQSGDRHWSRDCGRTWLDGGGMEADSSGSGRWELLTNSGPLCSDGRRVVAAVWLAFLLATHDDQRPYLAVHLALFVCIRACCPLL